MKIKFVTLSFEIANVFFRFFSGKINLRSVHYDFEMDSAISSCLKVNEKMTYAGK